MDRIWNDYGFIGMLLISLSYINPALSKQKAKTYQNTSWVGVLPGYFFLLIVPVGNRPGGAKAALANLSAGASVPQGHLFLLEDPVCNRLSGAKAALVNLSGNSHFQLEQVFRRATCSY